MIARTPAFRLLLATETFAPEIGGGERQAALLAQALRRRGHGVTLLTRCSREGLPRDAVEDGLRILRVPPAGPSRRAKWSLLLSALPPMLRLRALYEVILVSGYRILGVPALLAGRRLGKPVVLKADSLGEFSGEFFRAGLVAAGLSPTSAAVRPLLALRNRWLQGAEAHVAISRDIREELLAQGVPSERIHEIPNGVDTEVFRPAGVGERQELRDRLGLPAGPVLVYTGRLVRYKGLPGLLEAWRELCRRRPGTLVLVGEGGGDMHNCEAELQAFVADHGLSERFRITGTVSRVEDWLRAADLFVFPTANESFGLSLVEAMACGLPAVTTRAGGLADYVVDGVNALAIEPDDRDGLIAAVEALLDDPARAARLGAAARETACSRYSAEAVAGRYEELLSRLVAARAGAAS